MDDLFIIRKSKPGEETIEDCIDTAIANINLWRTQPDSEYLLDVFACKNLELAAKLIRRENGIETEEDKKR